MFISLAGSLLSVAAGIWGVLNGSSNIKGSGILSDRIRRAVADIDDYAERTFYLYDLLSAKADAAEEDEEHVSGDHGHRTPRSFKYRLPLVMTGIEESYLINQFTLVLALYAPQLGDQTNINTLSPLITLYRLIWCITDLLAYSGT